MEVDEDVVSLVSALRQDCSSEKAVLGVSRQAGKEPFSKEFVVTHDGLSLLFRSVCSAKASRSTRSNALRALTLLLDDALYRSLACDTKIVADDTLTALFEFVMSDVVLTVSRALHVLSSLSQPGSRCLPGMKRVLETMAADKKRKHLALLRSAFVGFALFDSNAYGIALAKNLVDFDAAFVTWMDDAQIFPLLVPLCENEVLVLSIAELQVSVVRRLREKANTPVSFDSNPEHLQLLERLWHCIGSQKGTGKFPGKSGAEWKTVGFQSDTPSTDFRSMGVFALEQLVFFVESCSTEVRMIMKVQTESESENYYPVATAAIIVSSVVLQAVEARVNGGNACLCVLADHINRLFIAVFRHVDTLFVERKLTYMEFSELIKVVSSDLTEVLAMNPPSVDDVALALKDASSPSSAKKKKNKHRAQQWQNVKQTIKDRVPGLSVQPLDLAGTMSASPSSTVGAVSIGGGAAGAAAKEQNPNLFTSTGGTSISSGSQSARTAVTSPAPVSKLQVQAPPAKMRDRETRALGKRLRKAAAIGDAKKVIECLSSGEVYSIVNDHDPDTRLTALHLACQGGHRDCVTLICAGGAALESAAIDVGTPLHCAANGGFDDVVRILLDAGAKNSPTSAEFGRTPLHLASYRGHPDVIKTLVENGADVSAADSEGNVPGDLWTGTPEIFKLLPKRSLQQQQQQQAGWRWSSPTQPTGQTTASLSVSQTIAQAPTIPQLQQQRRQSEREIELKNVREENADLRATVKALQEAMAKLELRVAALEKQNHHK